MASDTPSGPLYDIYRDRLGERPDPPGDFRVAVVSESVWQPRHVRGTFDGIVGVREPAGDGRPHFRPPVPVYLLDVGDAGRLRDEWQFADGFVPGGVRSYLRVHRV
jgi:hypothetical protein